MNNSTVLNKQQIKRYSSKIIANKAWLFRTTITMENITVWKQQHKEKITYLKQQQIEQKNDATTTDIG